MKRVVPDRGYRGHNAPPTHPFWVFIPHRRRRVTESINPDLLRIRAPLRPGSTTASVNFNFAASAPLLSCPDKAGGGLKSRVVMQMVAARRAVPRA